MAGWSSLPPDLVRRVGDRLLASSDLDYYVDMRGACHDWRSATADPRGRADARFEPEHSWVILEPEPATAKDDDDGDRLFLNLLTGRFLRRRLPLLLRAHDLVSFLSGFLVLRDGMNKDVFHYLNPLTGYMLHSTAKSDPPQVQAAMMDSLEDYDDNEYPVVSAGGEVLVVRRLHGALQVLRNHDDGKPMEPVKSIGCRAIFLGAERCLAVSADKLPTVDGDCVYYVGSLLDDDRHQLRDDAYPFEECVDMFRYDLSNGREEMISSPVADYFDRLGMVSGLRRGAQKEAFIMVSENQRHPS